MRLTEVIHAEIELAAGAQALEHGRRGQERDVGRVEATVLQVYVVERLHEPMHEAMQPRAQEVKWEVDTFEFVRTAHSFVNALTYLIDFFVSVTLKKEPNLISNEFWISKAIIYFDG